MHDRSSISDRSWLADWRRRVAELYTEVRMISVSDPPAAWTLWRDERRRLLRGHPQSPLPEAERAAFEARCWPYDERLRFSLVVEERPEPVPDGELATQDGGLALPSSGGESLAFDRVGALRLPLPSGTSTLSLFWMRGYAGGLFLPFRDPTNGRTTYGAGRYALDTAKGADLGGDPPTGTRIVDLNFAYHPSCAFDPRWACPLAPPENRLPVAVEAGERLR